MFLVSNCMWKKLEIILINELEIFNTLFKLQATIKNLNRKKELKHQRSIMFQQYQIMLLILVLLFSIEIKANRYPNYPNEDKFMQWIDSQVVIYTLKQQNFAFSKQKWDFQGKCFGNLISPKFVLTISSCILEEGERLVNDKIVKDLIEEARVSRVIFSALSKNFLYTLDAADYAHQIIIFYFCFQFIQVENVKTQKLFQVETGVDYIVYFYYLFKDKYTLSDLHNVDGNDYRKIQKIFLRKEVDDFMWQELAILELEIPYRKIHEESFNVLGYFGEENFRFKLENQGLQCKNYLVLFLDFQKSSCRLKGWMFLFFSDLPDDHPRMTDVDGDRVDEQTNCKRQSFSLDNQSCTKVRNMCNIFSLVLSKKPVTREN